MEHIGYVINDYYSDFGQESSIKYCNVIQVNLDSLFKYCISDIIQPYPIVPPDTFLFFNNCVIYYYCKFPPNIKRNNQILDSLKVAYKCHFDCILENETEYVIYDPPEPAYYFYASDTIGTKVEYDPQGSAMLSRLLKYYKNYSDQCDEN